MSKMSIKKKRVSGGDTSPSPSPKKSKKPRGVTQLLRTHLADFDPLHAVYTSFDLVNAAREVLGIDYLSRRSFVMQPTGGNPAGYTCRYPRMDREGINAVDYGTTTKEAVVDLILFSESVGWQTFPSTPTTGAAEVRRAFSTIKAAVDHMLTAIFLFHDGPKAEIGRKRWWNKIIRLNKSIQPPPPATKTSVPEERIICVVKLHAQDKETKNGPLFRLAQHGGQVYVSFVASPSKTASLQYPL